MSTLELRGVNKYYPGGDWAVRDLDLDIADGELFVLVGPSGCGKSTVLRMVAGLEEATTGDVLIDGERVNDVPPSKRDVALAFQQFALYPHMTVAENIGFPMYVDSAHREDIRRRVREVAETLQLSDVLDERPSRLSGGQQQRVSLGRAIIRSPRLLMMDEPLSNLDAKLRTQTRFMIGALQRRLGVTTLFVTHDQSEALALGDRLAVIDRGRLLQCGSPVEVYDRPENLFVAQFLGTPPMNVVRAQVRAAGDVIVLGLGSTDLVVDDVGRARLPGLAGLVGAEIGLGFRPEALAHDPDGPLVLSAISTEEVDQRQLVAAEIDASTVTEAGREIVVGEEARSLIVAALDPDDDVSIWQPFRLAIDQSGLHAFDLRTGVAIARA